MGADLDRDWARYWRTPDRRVEAMHARFRRHAYHRHSHETYSFGVTESGAQTFRCRGSAHTSGAGMVMAFNPDDPHDGHAADEAGFTYRMIHLDPALVSEVLAHSFGHPLGRPLFAEPVVYDRTLAALLRRLHAALRDTTATLFRTELLDATVLAFVRSAATRPARTLARDQLTTPAARSIARRVRALLDDTGGTDPSAGFTADDLAAAVGCSRYAMYRAFQTVYGLAPSDYERQVRLRTARTLLARGYPPALVATDAGFADQAHLTRWFVRYFGITPGAYRLASTAGLGRRDYLRSRQ